MKRMIFTAIAVCAVVGSALAFKVRNNPNLHFCNTQNRCQISNFNATVGVAMPNPGLYTGIAGAPCGSTQCPRYTPQTVFFNP